MMTFLLGDDQQVDFAVKFEDRYGHPAKVDGVPAWSSSDPDLLTVTAGAGGMSATATPAGPLGTVQVNVRADAAVGAEVHELIGTLDVEVVAGVAVLATIQPGAPTPRA